VRTALALLAVLAIAAALAPWIAPQNPYDLSQLQLIDSRLPPLARSSAGAIRWLGTDDQGRDMLSAILYGLRTSLAVGLASTALAFAIGVALGLAAAWFGGWVDALVMRLADLQLSFPSILIALVLLAVLGQGLDKIVAAIVAVQWATYARAAHAAARVERRREYIEAAVALALPAPRILFRHLLPNCLPPLIALAAVQVAAAITLEATLSFLGLGLPITQP
jgi:peptide/nickel transport system permease protein